MTSPFKKALRGAAGAGAELSLDQYRADLDTKKLEKMQKYQTGERVAGEAHDIKMQKLQNEGRAGAGATQGDIQLMNYLQEHGIASSPEEAYNKVREMDTDPSKIIIDIAKGMHAIDDSKPFAEHLRQAENDVKSLRERMNPKKEPPKEQPQGGPRKGIISQGMKSDHPIDQMLGATTGSESAEPSFKPAGLPPASERKVGQRYDTPRGPAVWREGGWELLNVTQ